MGKKIEYGVEEVVKDMGVLTLTHPFNFVKTLIQIGHEPLPKYTAKSWTLKDKQYYPGLVQYLSHIGQQDGFFGLYRGLVPRVYTALTFNLSRRLANEMLEKHFTEDEIHDSDDAVVACTKMAKACTKDSIAEIVGLAISHPFYVIAVRSMSQFIGRETAYDNLLSSVAEILENEGVSGFFKGFLPKAIGSVVAIWTARFLSHAFRKSLEATTEADIKENNETYKTVQKAYVPIIGNLVASTLTYGFLVTATCMQKFFCTHFLQ